MRCVCLFVTAKWPLPLTLSLRIPVMECIEGCLKMLPRDRYIHAQLFLAALLVVLVRHSHLLEYFV